MAGFDVNPQELVPRTLPLSPDAKNLLFGYYQATEQAQAPGGDLDQVKSFASKSPEQAARIAGVLTLWADLRASAVTAETMTDAIDLAQFYLFEAQRLAEAATVTEEIDRAEQLRHWIMESWPAVAMGQNRDPLTIVPRDVVTLGPNSLRETATVKKLMKTLADHGWLAQLDAGAVIDGQARRLAYRIVRPT